MELNIPGVHGVGDSILYFVDRFRDFSIYDVDFKPILNAPANPPALAGMHFFGVVQTIGRDRSPEWIDFYQQLMDFRPLPQGRYFGVLPKGVLLESLATAFTCSWWSRPRAPPACNGMSSWCGSASVRRTCWRRCGSSSRGASWFIDREPAQASEKGALTQLYKAGSASSW